MERNAVPGSGTRPVELEPAMELATPGPYDLASSAQCFVFAGRLEERYRLAAELHVDRRRSDAELALAAWRRWGDACCQRLQGRFVLAAFDPARRRALLARDPMGELALAYHHDPVSGRLVVGADEAAVAAWPGVPAGLDDDTVARFLAVEPPRAGATFHAAVAEVPAGHRVVLGPAGSHTQAYWRPPEVEQGGSETEWARRLRRALAAAVGDALADVEDGAPLGLMLSGGLDSSSVAALAATQRRVAGAAPPIAFSWTFDDPALAACDERRWIDAVTRHCGLEAQHLVADEAWPLSRPHPEPAWPLINPYRPLKQCLYAAAARRGARVLLCGAGGDLLWTAGKRAWLASLVASGRWGTATGEVAGLVAAGHWSALEAALRGFAAPRRRSPRRRWLRPETARRVASGDPVASRSSLQLRRAALLGPRASRGFAAEAAWARRAGLDLRDPFRDRRVVELALAMPPHLLYRPPNGEPARGSGGKYLLRRAMAADLPPAVLARSGSAPLGPLFRRGVCERAWGKVQKLLQCGETWRRHVNEEWMRRALVELADGRLEGPPAVAVWRVIALESWFSSRTELGLSPPASPALRIEVLR